MSCKDALNYSKSTNIPLQALIMQLVGARTISGAHVIHCCPIVLHALGVLQTPVKLRAVPLDPDNIHCKLHDMYSNQSQG